MKFEKSTKAQGFFGKKGFYVALAVCLVALGAASWTAVHTLRPPDVFVEVPPPVVSVPTRDVTIPVPNVPVSVEPPPPVSVESQEETPVEAPPPALAAPVMPLDGDIVKHFDNTRLQFNSTFNDWRAHLGINIRGEIGTDVVAATDGEVREVRTDPIWGVTVVIDHANGFVGFYSGLSPEVSVESGQSVKTGETIGSLYIVPAEAASGPLLYFATQKDGVWINPLEALGQT